MKNPSDPSLMASLISCIALVPASLSKIQHRIHILMNTKTIETSTAKNAMRLDVEFDTKNANRNSKIIGITTNAIFAV